MPNSLRRLLQSRYAKFKELRRFHWNQDSRRTRRQNLYLAEQMEARHLLSADAAPLAMDDLLRSQLDQSEVVEQLIENGLVATAANGKVDLELVREKNPEPEEALEELQETVEIEGSEEQGLVLDEDPNSAEVSLEADPEDTDASEGSLQGNDIRLLQQLSGHQFLVVDPGVDDVQQVLENFLGDVAEKLEWQTLVHGEARLEITTYAPPETPAIAVAEEEDILEDALQFASQSSTQITALILDQHHDGVEQITNVLSDFEDISALHILSKAGLGAAKLATTQLTNNNLERYRRELQSWGSALLAKGDILFYGIVQDHDEFAVSTIDRLAGVTQDNERFISSDWIIETESGLITETSESIFSQRQGFAVNDPRYDAHSATTSQDSAINGSTELSDVVTEIVFVDSGVEDYEDLIASLELNGDTGSDIEVVILDANQNGLEQIDQVLSTHQGLATVHILSHGGSGVLRLGDSNLDQSSLDENASLLENWKNSFSEDADILLYGCDVADGEWGMAFVENLARLSGADVAASVDATGGTALGGNWALEASTGVIESRIIHAENYEYLLDSITDAIEGHVLNANLNLGGSSPIVAKFDPNSRFSVSSVNAQASTGGVSYKSIYTELGINTLTLSSASDELNFNNNTEVNAVDVNAGGGNDTFYINDAVKLSGTLDAQTGDDDTLSYANFKTSVQFDLVEGTSTGFTGAGKFQNFENYEGSKQRDTFITSTQNEAMDGGLQDDTYRYADLTAWGIDEINDSSGDGDTLDFSDLTSTLFVGVADTGLDISTTYTTGVVQTPLDDTGNTLKLTLGGITPPTYDNPDPGNLSFGLLIEDVARDVSVNADYTVLRQQIIDELQAEIDAENADKAAGGIGEFDLQYIAGQLIIESAGNEMEVWSGTNVNGSGENSGRVGVTVLKGLAPPAQDVVHTTQFVLKLTGRDAQGFLQVSTQVVDLSNTYTQSTASARRAAWLNDIQNALNAAAPVAPGEIDQDTVSERLQAAWLDDIKDEIVSVFNSGSASMTQADIDLALDADNDSIMIRYHVFSGDVNGIWNNGVPAGWGQPAEQINTLLNVTGIDIIKLGKEENNVQFADAPATDMEFVAVAGASVNLDLSALSESVEIELAGEGTVILSVAGNTVKANNVNSIITGSGNDKVVFKAGASLALLDLGSGNHEFDYSDWGSAINHDFGATDNAAAPGLDAFIHNGGAFTIISSAEQDWVKGGVLGDELQGGVGNDILSGKDGEDTLLGESGEDTLYGGLGVDTLRGGDDNDILRGWDDGDFLYGDKGNDTLYGEAGEDTLEGGADDDTLYGGLNRDILRGGAGNDTLIGGEGGTIAEREILDGGGGTDSYIFENGWGHDEIEEGYKDTTKDNLDFSAVTDTTYTILSDGNLYVGVGDNSTVWSTNQDALSGTTVSTGSVPGQDNYIFTDSVISDDLVGVENIIASNADNTFLFGNDWGLKSTSSVDFKTAWDNRKQHLEIDTSNVIDNNNDLVLDFRGVSQELQFEFKADGSLEVSRVEDIEWIKRFLGDGIFAVAGDVVDWLQDKERLMVGFEIPFNTITFSHVDENTVIYGGRNHNTFTADQNATYPGTIFGGTGRKPGTDILKELLEQNSSGLSIPEVTDVTMLTVTNVIDISGRTGNNRASIGNIYSPATADFGFDSSRVHNIDDITFDPSGLNVIVGNHLGYSNSDITKVKLSGTVTPGAFDAGDFLVKSFDIVSIDDANDRIVIKGKFSELFNNGQVLLSDESSFQVASSSYDSDTKNTTINLAPGSDLSTKTDLLNVEFEADITAINFDGVTLKYIETSDNLVGILQDKETVFLRKADGTTSADLSVKDVSLNNLSFKTGNNTITVSGGFNVFEAMYSLTQKTTFVDLDDNTIPIGKYVNGDNVYRDLVIKSKDDAKKQLILDGQYNQIFEKQAFDGMPHVITLTDGSEYTLSKDATYNKSTNQTTLYITENITGLNIANNIRYEAEITFKRDLGSGFFKQLQFNQNVMQLFADNAEFKITNADGSVTDDMSVQNAERLMDLEELNLGLSLITGGTGGDTYKFEGGFWGMAAIIETPDASVSYGDNNQRVSLPEFYDTLDFSEVALDLTYDIYQVSTSNIAFLQDLFTFNKDKVNQGADPISFEIGTNIVLVSPQAAFFKETLGFELDFTSLFSSWPDWAPTSFPLLMANDIENIVGGSGENVIKLHGDAYLQGTVTGEKVVFDYSDFNHNQDSRSGVEIYYNDLDPGVVANATYSTYLDAATELNYDDYKGLNIELIPDFTYPIIGTIKGWEAAFGYAEGVQGHRLAGLEDYIDLIFGTPNSFTGNIAHIGTSGFSGVVDSAGNDLFVGSGPGETFMIGQGGLDIIDGGGDSPTAGARDTNGVGGSFSDGSVKPKEVFDIISLEKLKTKQAVVDLENGTAWVLADGNTFNPLDFDPGNKAYNSADFDQIAYFVDIEGAKGGEGKDLIIGSSGKDKFELSIADIGDVIIGNGSQDIIDLAKVPFYTTVEVVSDAAEIEAIILANTDLAPANPSRTDLKLIRFNNDNNKVIAFYGDAKIEGNNRLLKIAKNLPVVGRVAGLFGSSRVTTPNAGAQSGDALDDTFLADSAFNSLVDQARSNWAAIVGQNVVDQNLGNLSFAQADLDKSVDSDPDNSLLAETTDNGSGSFSIVLDTTAADYGWNTALTDPAIDEIDLLTVLMHEMGHILGISHDGTDLMGEILDPGERSLPEADIYDIGDQQNLEDGMNAFKDWIAGMGTRINDFLTVDDIPFVGDYSFASLFGLDDDFGDDLTAAVNSAINVQFAALFGTDITTGEILDINGISENLNSTYEKAFSASLDIVSDQQLLSFDLGGLSLDGFGIGFDDLPITVTGAADLVVDAALKLDFGFGLDDSGQFFVESPTLSASLQLLADGIDVGISLFDIIGAQIDNGLIDIKAGLELAYNDELSLTELQNNTINVSNLNPSWGGQNYYDISLPISLTGALEGLGGDGIRIWADSAGLGAATFVDDNGNPTGISPVELLATLPAMLQVDGFDDLANFKNMSLSQILAGLKDIIRNWTDPDNTDSPLQQKIPGVDKSVNELLGGTLGNLYLLIEEAESLADSFTDIEAAEDWLNNEIADMLEAALDLIYGVTGFYDFTDPDFFSFSYEDSQLFASLNMDMLFSDTLGFDLNLAEHINALGLDSLGLNADDLLNLTANAELQVSAFAGLYLGVGVDLSAWSETPVSELNAASFNPKNLMFVDGGSGVSFNANLVSSTPIDAEVSIDLSALSIPGLDFLLDDLPSIGFEVIDGYLELGLEGFLGIEEKDDGGIYLLSELSSDVFGFDYAANGVVDLPLFFLPGNLAIGGTTKDKNGDGIGDNHLYMDVGFDENGFVYDLATPDFAKTFSIAALLNDPKTVLYGLETMFDGLKGGLADRFAELELPLIDDALKDAAAFINDIRDSLMGEAEQDSDGDYIRDGGTSLLTYTSAGLGQTLQAGAAAGKTTVELIQVAMFDSLKDLLQVPVKIDGEIQFDSNGLPLYRDVESPEDIEISFTSDGALTFNVLIADTVGIASVPISFDVSAPGLGLRSGPDDKINIDLAYTFGLGFGFDTGGVFLDTSGVTESGSEFDLLLSALLSEGASLEAEIGFLKAELVDVAGDDDGESGLYGRLSFDLTDSASDDDDRWYIGESLEATGRLNASANVDLGVAVGVEGVDSLPGVTTTLHYDQVFANIELSSSAGASASFFETPDVMFEAVTLDLGSLLSGVLGPALSEVNAYIGPDTEIYKLVQLLSTEIDLGIDKFSLVDLSYLKDPSGKTADRFNAFIDAFKTVADLSQLVADSEGEAILIPLGDFIIGGGLLSDPDAEVTQSQVSSSQTDAQRQQAQDNATQGSNSAQVTKKIGVEPGSFQLPILSNPMSALGYLMGRDVDLFVWDMPDLVLEFDYTQSIPIYPGLNARIGAAINAYTDLSFGFDTRGIRLWQEESFDINDADLILDGFYFGDWDENGNEKPEVSLTASLKAGASVGIGGLVEAGVEGGVETNITLDLNDKPKLGTGGENQPPAIYDGKVYFDELLGRLDDGIECLFDVHGDITVFLEAFFWAGVKIFGAEITVFEARDRFVEYVLAEFDYSCPEKNATVATLENGVLTLAYDPEDGNIDDEKEKYKVEYKEDFDWLGDGTDLRDLYQVNGNGVVQYFDANKVTKIYASGTSFDDKYDIDTGNRDVEIEVHGGAGNDTIEIASMAATRGRSIYGDEGNDTIIGSELDDLIVGGSGNDKITALDGSDTIYTVTMNSAVNNEAGNTRNNDYVDAGDGDDFIYAGDGTDILLGEDGKDYISGGAGNDTISGGQGNDELHGGDNDDTMLGGSGIDTMFGDAGEDYLAGNTGNDVTSGGAGDDSFDWFDGDGKDTIYGYDDAHKGASNSDYDKIKMQTPRWLDRETVSDSGGDDELSLNRNGDNATINWNGVIMTPDGISGYYFDMGEGVDTVVVEDLSSTMVASIDIDLGARREVKEITKAAYDKDGNLTGENDTFNLLEKNIDQQQDRLEIYGGTQIDEFILSDVQLKDGETGEDINALRIEQVSGVSFGITQTSNSQDMVIVDGRGGDDRIDASDMLVDLVYDLRLLGSDGKDTLVGSNFDETIIGGSGADRITGGLEEDLFVHADYPDDITREEVNGVLVKDTLVEERNGNFNVSDSQLIITYENVNSQLKVETENLNSLFEKIEFTGGNNVNTFTLANWSGDGLIDGLDGSDIYVINLSQAAVGANFINIDDNGTDGKDSLEYYGSSETDLIQLDTVYQVSKDPEGQFSEDRWLDFGNYDAADGGDGLIIAHFGAALAGYTEKDLDDTDALFEVGVSSLLASKDYQVLNYSTVEEVAVFGSEGDDVFISDDTATEISVYGNEGDDQFYIGSILELEDVLVEGQEITVAIEVTHGTSYELSVFGGDDDDYFEVSHNAEEINLYGDNGDDTFFIKALLTLDEEGKTKDLDSEEARVNAGKLKEDETDTREVDVDSLVYVENANVNIDGGAGFDSVAVVGTALSDTFYVWAESVFEMNSDGILVDTGKVAQRIFGAGIKLNQLVNIERLVLLTGAGDDRVYINGTNLGPNADMVINLGSGSDEVYMGHEAKPFVVNFPKKNSVEYSTLTGYERGNSYNTWGRTIYDVATSELIIPYTLRLPASSENRTLPDVRTLEAFKSPVTIVGGLGKLDKLIIDNEYGSENLTFSNTQLLKKQIITNDELIEYPVASAVVAGGLTDLLNQDVASNEQVAEILAGFLRNHILFQDKYINTNLINEIQSLTGTDQQELELPAGISYAVFQDTLIPDPDPEPGSEGAKIKYTAREQLEKFLEGTGYKADYDEYPIPGSEGTEIYFELTGIVHETTLEELAFETQNKTIRINGEEHRNMIGLSLITASNSEFKVAADYITEVKLAEREPDKLNTLSIDDLPSNIFFEGFDEVTLNLGQETNNTFLMENDLFDGILTVEGGDLTDTFTVNTSIAQAFLIGNAGNDFYNVGNGNVDSITSELFLMGGADTDSIVVNNTELVGVAEAAFTKNYLEHTFSQQKLNKISSLLGVGDSDSKGISDNENEAVVASLRQQTAIDIELLSQAGFEQFETVIALAGQVYADELLTLVTSTKEKFDANVARLTEDTLEAFRGGIELGLDEYILLEGRISALDSIKVYRDQIDDLLSDLTTAESDRDAAYTSLSDSLTSTYPDYPDIVVDIDTIIATLLEDNSDADTLRADLDENKKSVFNAALTLLIEDYKAASDEVTSLLTTYAAEGSSFSEIINSLTGKQSDNSNASLAFNNYLQTLSGYFVANEGADVAAQLGQYFADTATAESVYEVSSLQDALAAEKTAFEDTLTTLTIAYEAATAGTARDAALVNITNHLATLRNQDTITAVTSAVNAQLALYVADPGAVNASSVKDLSQVQTALTSSETDYENQLQVLAEAYKVTYDLVVAVEQSYVADGADIASIISTLQPRFDAAELALSNSQAAISSTLDTGFGTSYTEPEISNFDTAINAYLNDSVDIDTLLATLDNTHTAQATTYGTALTTLLNAYSAQLSAVIRLETLISQDSLSLGLAQDALTNAPAGDTELRDLLEDVVAYRQGEFDTGESLTDQRTDLGEKQDNLIDFINRELGLLEPGASARTWSDYSAILDQDNIPEATLLENLITQLESDADTSIALGNLLSRLNFEDALSGMVTAYKLSRDAEARLSEELSAYGYTAPELTTLIAEVQQLRDDFVAGNSDVQAFISNGGSKNDYIGSLDTTAVTAELDSAVSEIAPLIQDILDVLPESGFDEGDISSITIALQALNDGIDGINENESPSHDLVKTFGQSLLTGLGFLSDLDFEEGQIIKQLADMQIVLDYQAEGVFAISNQVTESSSFADVQALFEDSTTGLDLAELTGAYKDATLIAKRYGLGKSPELQFVRDTLDSLTRLKVYTQFLPASGTLNIQDLFNEYQANLDDYATTNNDPNRIRALTIKAESEAKLKSLEKDKITVDAVVRDNQDFSNYYSKLTSYYYWYTLWIEYLLAPSKAIIDGALDQQASINSQIADEQEKIDNQYNGVEFNLTATDERLAELDEILKEQYAIIKALGPVILDVLVASDETTDQDLIELLEDDSSLIASIQKYSNEYAVVADRGNEVIGNPRFSGSSFSTVISNIDSVDYSATLLSLTGLNLKGIHADYDTVENFTLNTGNGSDVFAINDSLGQLISTVFVNSGEGDDEFTVSNVELSTDDIVATVVIDAGNGNNLLNINDLNDSSADAVTMTNDARSGYTSVTGIADGNIHYRGAFGKGVTLQAGLKNDEIIINGLIAGAPTMVLGGEENDVITASFAAQAGSSLTIKGEDGDDWIDAVQAGFFVTIEGNLGNDTLYGSVFDDFIFGNDGDDLIIAGIGNDNVSGGAGNDGIVGDNGSADYLNGRLVGLQSDGVGGGNDTIVITEGNNFIIGGAGLDTITTGTGNDVIAGDNAQFNIAEQLFTADETVSANDNVTVSGGHNLFLLGLGDDELSSGADNDVVLADAGSISIDLNQQMLITSSSSRGGRDTVTLLGGSNIVFGGAGSDTISTGTGIDWIVADTGVLDSAQGLLQAIANGTGDDVVTSSDGDNWILAGLGNDSVATGSGDDNVFGDNGRIQYINGIAVYLVNDEATGGNDTIAISGGDNFIMGGAGGDTISTGTGIDWIVADTGVLDSAQGLLQAIANGTGDDVVTSSDGDNWILAGLGNDSVATGSGDDIIFGDNGLIQYSNNLADYLIDNEAAGGIDTIDAGDGNNTILAGAGDDDVTAGLGFDKVHGDTGYVDVLNQRMESTSVGTGDDNVSVGAGGSWVIGALGNDELSSSGGNETDVMLGDNGIIELINGDLHIVTILPELGGDDIIVLDGGNDIAIGGIGDDRLAGGEGNDILLGDHGELLDAGSLRTIDTTDPFLSGDDVLDGGDSFDILIGGGGNDEFIGNFRDNLIIGNFGKVADDSSIEGVYVSSDPTSRDLITRMMFDLYNFSVYSDLPMKKVPVEFSNPGLGLNPVLSTSDFGEMNNIELRDFLRNLPFAEDNNDLSTASERSGNGSSTLAGLADTKPMQADGAVGDFGKSASDLGIEIDVPPSAMSSDILVTGPVSAEVIPTEIEEGPEAAQAAAALLLVAVQRRGWQYSNTRPEQVMSGAPDSVNSLNSSRRYKPWTR